MPNELFVEIIICVSMQILQVTFKFLLSDYIASFYVDYAVIVAPQAWIITLGTSLFRFIRGNGVC